VRERTVPETYLRPLCGRLRPRRGQASWTICGERSVSRWARSASAAGRAWWTAPAWPRSAFFGDQFGVWARIWSRESYSARLRTFGNSVSRLTSHAVRRCISWITERWRAFHSAIL